MEPSASSDPVLSPADYLITPHNFSLERIKTGAVLLFNKPKDWSSFKLVKKVKYYTKAARVGHAGTLDPLATGLLIVCTGKCTKIIERIQDMEKTYTGVFHFGKTTPSFDLETPFDAEYPVHHITPEAIQSSVATYTGTVAQTPPVYSAIKVNGTRAYKFARNGEDVVLKSRDIHIYDFTVDGKMPDMAFSVRCSKGTYIRTLAHDFGKSLGSGCYLDNLRRTAIGDFKIEDAFEIEKFQELCGF